MKKKIILLLTVISCIFLLTACGEDPQLLQFEKDMNVICDKLANIDKQINSIDPKAENSTTLLINNLNELNSVLKNMADMDFPEKFDYLEPIADEASELMVKALENYRLAYANGTYDDYSEKYAFANYERANKRIKIILSFLHGETPEDVNYTYSTEETTPSGSLNTTE